MKIINYVVAEGSNPASLASVVSNYISSGYQPFGSLNTVFDNANTVYVQAMVMYESSDSSVIEEIPNPATLISKA